MKMSSDLDQWLIRPNSTSAKQRVSDPLADFRKMSISSTESSRKFCLPSILTSDNNSTWLATRKNDNDLAKSAANKSNQNQSGFIKINQDQTESIKINQDDNAKWLLKPLNKSETDLVTLTDEKKEPNPWLAPSQTSVMTTSLDSLPGTFNLPLKFSGGLSKIFGFQNLILPNKLRRWSKIWKTGFWCLLPLILTWQLLVEKIPPFPSIKTVEIFPPISWTSGKNNPKLSTGIPIPLVEKNPIIPWKSGKNNQ